MKLLEPCVNQISAGRDLDLAAPRESSWRVGREHRNDDTETTTPKRRHCFSGGWPQCVQTRA